MYARIAIAVICTAVAGGSVFAQESPLSLEEAQRIALSTEPKVQALNAEAAALINLSVADRKLPDVQVRTGLMNFPLEHGGFRSEGMTHLSVGLRQSVPPRGRRTALANEKTGLATQKRELANSRARDVTLQVRNAWLESYFGDHAVELVSESRSLFVELVRVARSLYSVGTRNQNDVLQAELELSKLDDRLLQVKQSRRESYAALGRLLDQPVTVAVLDELPDWSTVPPLADLQDRLIQHPIISASNAQLEADNARYDIEKSAFNPLWTFDLAYSYRDGQLPNDTPRSDFVSATVSFNVPIWGREREVRRMSAASAQKESTALNRSLLLRELRYELVVAHSRWETLSNRKELYEQNMIRQSDDHAQATLAAYRNKLVGMTDVVRSYIEQIDTQIAHLRLRVDRLKTWAQIDSLVEIGK
ncbi:MAG: TolC family protein [Gammaproteobacteria bacterium]|nr:TolC family protein [Gammaproteobacteria bacterium]